MAWPTSVDISPCTAIGFYFRSFIRFLLMVLPIRPLFTQRGALACHEHCLGAESLEPYGQAIPQGIVGFYDGYPIRLVPGRDDPQNSGNSPHTLFSIPAPVWRLKRMWMEYSAWCSRNAGVCRSCLDLGIWRAFVLPQASLLDPYGESMGPYSDVPVGASFGLMLTIIHFLYAAKPVPQTWTGIYFIFVYYV